MNNWNRTCPKANSQSKFRRKVTIFLYFWTEENYF